MSKVLSHYDFVVPALIHYLNNTAVLLKKASGHVKPEELVKARLYQDMHTLTGQVQAMSDAANAIAARVGGVEKVPMPDTETTLEQVLERIEKSITFVKTVDKAKFDEIALTDIHVPYAGGITLPATQYMSMWALPNFYFHVTTAYDIMRHVGVPVGKRDFLGY